MRGRNSQEPSLLVRMRSRPHQCRCPSSGVHTDCGVKGPRTGDGIRGVPRPAPPPGACLPACPSVRGLSPVLTPVGPHGEGGGRACAQAPALYPPAPRFQSGGRDLGTATVLWLVMCHGATVGSVSDTGSCTSECNIRAAVPHGDQSHTDLSVQVTRVV